MKYEGIEDNSFSIPFLFSRLLKVYEELSESSYKSEDEFQVVRIYNKSQQQILTTNEYSMLKIKSDL